MKNSIPIILLLLISTLFSCANPDNMSIEPIDKELNERLITGERLRPELFSRTDLLQYYQVADADGLPPEDVQHKLDTFISTTYKLVDISKANSFTVFFYNKKMTVDYSENLYESVRDNENGAISGQEDNLLDVVTFQKIKGSDDKLLRYRIQYNDGTPVLDLKDTLEIKE